MTLPRIAALRKYWDEHPPVDLLVASLVGFKPPETKAAQAKKAAAVQRTTVAEMMRVFGLKPGKRVSM